MLLLPEGQMAEHAKSNALSENGGELDFLFERLKKI